jgi:phage-related protein
MALTIGDLVGYIRADDSGMRRGLSDAELRMRGFQRDTEGRLRHLDGRFATLGEQIAAGLRTGTDEGDRFGASLRNLAGMAGRLGGLAASIGGIAGGLGAAVPLVAGLAAAVANMAPAAALAVSGLIAVRLAAGALKLGMIGVEDAVTAALDPSKAAEFEEALKKLAPSAQAFARQVKALAPEFKKLQQDVQERLFKGLDSVLKEMGTTTLPVLRKGLVDAAGSLNAMAKGVGAAAVSLSKSGILGRAVDGATTGLSNLSRVPGQLVTGLGQVGAAAAPAFAKLTASAGKAFDKLAAKLTKAFESGEMQAAIERAISLIGELAAVVKNIGSIIGSIFSAAEASGGGFLGVLKEITGQAAKAFASPEVQAGLQALFGVMSQLAKSVGPILVSLLKTVGSVLKVLGPPVEQLVKHLGDGLLKIAVALGPVVVTLASAFGQLLTMALPLVDLAADLIAAILPALTPLFTALGAVIKAATPLVAQLAATLGAVLMPIITTLATQVLPKLVPPFVELVNRIFPQLTNILVQLTPSLTDLGLALADLLVELTPLIVKVLELGVALFDDLMPYLGPLIGLIVKLTAGALMVMAGAITRYVIPAVQAIAALLRGDFSGALQHGKTIASNFVNDVVRRFLNLRDRAGQALTQLGQSVGRSAAQMGQSLVRSVQQKLGEAAALFRGLPGLIRSSIPGAGGILHSIGQAIIRGLINGVTSMIPSLSGTLGRITASLPDWKGPAETDAKILTPAGQKVMQGFMGGIASQVPALQRQLQGLTGAVPGMAMGPMTARPYAGAGAGGGQQRVVIEFRGPQWIRDAIREVVQTDGRGNVQVAFGQR